MITAAFGGGLLTVMGGFGVRFRSAVGLGASVCTVAGVAAVPDSAFGAGVERVATVLPASSRISVAAGGTSDDIAPFVQICGKIVLVDLKLDSVSFWIKRCCTAG